MTGIEGYRLLRRLGAGGMGTVHEALDADGRRVAIKVIHESISADPAARQRLRREVELLHRVRHQRVARVLDAEVDGVDAFVVTELVEGPTLEDEVSEHGPLAGADLLELAEGLADGLDAIHGAGITHRDLKPGNVMLAPHGPVIIDFGIAQVADDVRLTQTGMITGTPGYLDPDVIAGTDPGPDGDWWAWAAVLAFAATGRAPFGRGTIPAVLARVSTGVVDTAGLPEVLARALRAALDPEPSRRLPPDDLLAVISGEWDLATLTDVLQTRPPLPATRAVDAPATPLPPSYAPAAPATRSLPASGAEPWAPSPDGWQGTAPDDGGSLAPTSTSAPWDALPPLYGGSLASPPTTAPWQGPPPGLPGQMFDHAPPEPASWAVPPGRHPGTVGVLGLALSGLAVLAPGTWGLLLAGLLVLLGTLGRGSQWLRARRRRRGLRRGDSARTWLAAPWHLLWALAAALPGLLVGAALGASLWWLTGSLGDPSDPGPPLILWGAALLITMLVWALPPSGAAREGTNLVIEMLPRALRLTLTLLALAALGALVTAVVMGTLPEPSWAPWAPAG